ncbi:hypothetical protein AAFF_G00398230 [Aldrovandia affinis]|uniref:Uncharacterized protein n=1 Tax=Aldrovandia affinis TaxID=143900 RepID=A0AAD7VYS9_9TELE|nr:hypothetical protein AAFF_G00398230 [Aldrovandia affinis]
MEPWQVINSQGNGPYAVKTQLGWVVNGPLSSCPTTEEPGTRSATVNRISMENLKDMLVRQYNQDFPEKENEEKREMSCEDRRFMDLATSSAVLKNRHYHLPLPFRDKDVVMPNNHEMAVQRTVNLARRFKKDSAYAAEYKAFMDNVLAKGYTERVPQEQLHRNDGHRGTYHITGSTTNGKTNSELCLTVPRHIEADPLMQNFSKVLIWLARFWASYLGSVRNG